MDFAAFLHRLFLSRRLFSSIHRGVHVEHYIILTFLFTLFVITSARAEKKKKLKPVTVSASVFVQSSLQPVPKILFCRSGSQHNQIGIIKSPIIVSTKFHWNKIEDTGNLEFSCEWPVKVRDSWRNFFLSDWVKTSEILQKSSSIQNPWTNHKSIKFRSPV